MVDAIDKVKAELGRRKNNATEKILNQVFEDARSKVESGQITPGMDVLDKVLDNGMEHAQQVLQKHGVESVDHEGVARLRRYIEAGRRLQSEDAGLEAVDQVESFVKERWNK